MKEHNLLKIVGQAIQDYHMIGEGDTLWVGISGAPKSFVALLFLHKRLSYIPLSYTLKPLHILTPTENPSAIEAWYEPLRKRFSLPPLLLIPLPPEGISLFAHHPRQAILQTLFHHCGPGKLVLGDSLDDIVLSALCALIYHRRWSPLLPHYPLCHFPMSILRPLAYLSHRHISTYIHEYHIPTLYHSHPLSKGKENLHSLLEDLRPLLPTPLHQVFAAFRNPKREYFLNPLHETPSPRDISS
ncbi:MAG: hypothetical protein N2314_05330 [Brevinematales bacterium]|nr:hypothetical protein [Brevinematales bacterium]